MKSSVTIFIVLLSTSMAFSSSVSPWTESQNKLLYDCLEATNDAVHQSGAAEDTKAERGSGFAILDYPGSKNNVEEALILFDSKIYRGVIDSSLMHLVKTDPEGTKNYVGWFVFEMGPNTYHLVINKWVNKNVTQKYSTDIFGVAENNLTPTLFLNETDSLEEDTQIFESKARDRIKILQKADQDTLWRRTVIEGITDFVISDKGKDTKQSIRDGALSPPEFKLVPLKEAANSARSCLKMGDPSMTAILQGIIAVENQ